MTWLKQIKRNSRTLCYCWFSQLKFSISFHLSDKLGPCAPMKRPLVQPFSDDYTDWNYPSKRWCPFSWAKGCLRRHGFAFPSHHRIGSLLLFVLLIRRVIYHLWIVSYVYSDKARVVPCLWSCVHFVSLRVSSFRAVVLIRARPLPHRAQGCTWPAQTIWQQSKTAVITHSSRLRNSNFLFHVPCGAEVWPLNQKVTVFTFRNH